MKRVLGVGFLSRLTPHASRLTLLAALTLGSFPAVGSAPQEGDSLSVSLLTFSPGETYWQRFGHNALLVRDSRSGEALAYNYGLFDFEQENFFLNFARGRMRYQLGVFELAPMLAAYRRDGRGVWEQRLNLAPSRRAELDRFLRWNAQPQNAAYYYDYFRDNCSTRVRDALDRAVGGALKSALTGRPAGITYREESVRLLWPDPLLASGMDLSLGPASDRPLDLWDAAFSPRVLMDAVRGVAVADAAGLRPLVAGEAEMVAAAVADAPAELPGRIIPFAVVGLMAAGILLGLGVAGWTRGTSAFAVGFLLVCGAAGLISLVIWGLTAHWAGWRNPVLLLVNPLCLAMLPAWWRAGQAPWRVVPSNRHVAALVLAMATAFPILAVLGFGMASMHWFALLWPMHAALGFLVLRHRPV